MSRFKQLLLFELSEQERQELASYLEYDYDRFPANWSEKGFMTGDHEVELWIERSKKIDQYIDRHFKQKQS